MQYLLCSHEGLSPFLSIDRITDLNDFLRISSFVQIDPRGFVNSTVKKSPPSLKKDSSSLSGPVALGLSGKPVFLLTSNSDAGMVSTCVRFTCKEEWKAGCPCGPTKLLPEVFYPTRQSTVLRMSQCIVGLLAHFA